MASGPAAAFLTGFMNTTATNIKEKKDKADEYFDQQMELARTRGLDALDKNKAKMNGALTVAKQLQAVGMPRDLIMSIANQNPDDLPQYLTMVQDLQTRGVPVGPDYFKGIVKASGSFKAPDEDLATFFSRVFEPLKSAGSADPESFKRDPHGSIWATMMGSNAMDLARDKLDTTEVWDGNTASDLLKADRQTELNHPFGDSTVVTDAAKMGDDLRSAKASQTPGRQPRATDVKLINEVFDKAFDAASLKQKDAIVKSGGDPSTFDEDKATAEAAQSLVDSGYEDYLGLVPRIVAGASRHAQSGSVGAPTAPSDPEASGVAPPAGTAPVAAPVASPEASGGELPPALPNGWQLYKDLGDGTSVWIKDGLKKRVKNEEVHSVSTPQTQAPAGAPMPTDTIGN